MDDIVLSRDGVRVIFDEPELGSNGWLESYQVTLETMGLNARTRVFNPPYSTSPTQLFEEISQDWRG